MVNNEVGVQNVNGKWRTTEVYEGQLPKGTLTYQGYAFEANGAARKYGNVAKITIK